MPEYIYKTLEELNKKIYKMKDEAERIADKLENALLNQDTYRSEKELTSDDDYDRVASLEEASEKMLQIANELLEITTQIEMAQGII